MTSNAEAGVRRTEVYFARESLDSNANPQTPADPTFHLYSSVVNTTEAEPSAEYENRTGVGNYVPIKKNRQQETHEITVEYDLERFLVDSSGNPQDAYADASLRGTDHRIENTHSYLAVEEKDTILPESTWHYRYYNELGKSHPSGSAPTASSKPTRLEHYGRGCVPEEASMEMAPEDSSVVSNEIQYNCHKFRRYQIDQPSSAQTIAVKSTDTADTGATVEIETVDGSQSETLSLDGSDATVLITSANTYDSLRVWLPSDIAGDLEVYTYDSTNSTAGQLLTVIRGKTSRDGIEGDRGVPTIGSGSWETETVFNDGVTALGTDLTFDGHNAAENVASTTITVENEVEENATDSGLVQDIRAGTQTIEAESTVYGETESAQTYDEHLKGREAQIQFSIEGGNVTIPRAYISDGGSTERESGSAVMQVEVTWTGMMPTDGSDPLQFNPSS